jgi:hypothetical protein
LKIAGLRPENEKAAPRNWARLARIERSYLLRDRHIAVKHLEHENAEAGPIIWTGAIRLLLVLTTGSL